MDTSENNKFGGDHSSLRYDSVGVRSALIGFVNWKIWVYNVFVGARECHVVSPSQDVIVCQMDGYIDWLHFNTAANEFLRTLTRTITYQENFSERRYRAESFQGSTPCTTLPYGQAMRSSDGCKI